MYLTARARAGIVSDDLWVGRKGGCTVSMIRLMLVRRSKIAGVQVSAHQFRRSVAQRWLRKGGSETLLRSNLGWRSTTMVARYIRQNASELAMVEARRVLGN